MRGALLLMTSLLATGCLGGGGEEGYSGPVPVTGRWRQMFPVGEEPPFGFFEEYEFRDDGTFTDLARQADGTYVLDSGILTMNLDFGSGPTYKASSYLREDRTLLMVAMRPRRTDDGWVGTWFGDQVESGPQSVVETDWELELRDDNSAELSWMSSVDAGRVAGAWHEEDDGSWVIFEGDGNRIGFATLQGRAISRMAFEQF